MSINSRAAPPPCTPLYPAPEAPVTPPPIRIYDAYDTYDTTELQAGIFVDVATAPRTPRQRITTTYAPPRPSRRRPGRPSPRPSGTALASSVRERHHKTAMTTKQR
ncbi:hypothetical protein [Streptomyces noursei]|uniref:hypothetical protein n=1 Tax=Streptomyces noursei TaxID=1971 RepID=UPI00167B1F9F|nr:hypothetical protein [Streptomyces noursei]MCZ1018556.1 hypothetical protein [Streptomyces noursei]